MSDRWKFRALLLLAGACGLGSYVAQAADPLSPTTSLVASAGAAAPTQSSFTITTPEDLVITLEDLQNPHALTSLSVAITQGGQLTAGYTLSSETPTATLKAASGTYTVSVFGVPDATAGAGSFSLCIAPSNSPTSCLLPGAPTVGGDVASFAGTISAQNASQNSTLSTTSYSLIVPSPGGFYTITYADFAFPVSLSSSGNLSPNPNLGLFQGGQPLIGGLGFSSGTSFNLAPGTYTLLAVAQADPTVMAGSYGITVSGPAGSAPLLDVAVPVGQIVAPSSISNPNLQSLTLSVTDYAFPSALSQAEAMLTVGGSKLLGTTFAGGPVTATAGAGTLQLWSYATAASTAGTYGIDVATMTSDLFLAARGVAGSGGSFAYAFVTPSLTANTTYQAAAVDLQFPSALSAISFAVAHDGMVTKQTTGNATLAFTPTTSRPAVVLVSASTPTSGTAASDGLFDVNVQTAASSPLLIFDQTQAVSSTPHFFDTRTINIATAGSYDVTLNDLKFPAAFGSLALAVTQGGQIVGKIFGGGTFTFAPTAGNYQLTFVATPQSTQQFGMYGVAVQYAPPTVSLTSSAASAVTGSSITLSWTTTNATSCTGSGTGFTGNFTPGMNSQSVTLAATTTFTLQCTGPAGSNSGSTAVTATAASSGWLDFGQRLAWRRWSIG
ncbi:MAG: hypothetical protein WDM77_01865 [Steroidobacteraceae bacterium]